jgi:hypothetical protein
MRAALVALAVVLTCSLALAHERPAQRTVVVQVEDQSAALLVTWTAPTGILGQLMLARATILNPRDPQAGLEMLMAGRALSALHIEVDGKPLAPAEVRQKLTFDTSSQRRIAVSVLVSVQLPPSGRLRVWADGHERSKLRWLDRSAGRSARSSSRPGRWQRQPLEIRLSANR